MSQTFAVFSTDRPWGHFQFFPTAPAERTDAPQGHAENFKEVWTGQRVFHLAQENGDGQRTLGRQRGAGRSQIVRPARLFRFQLEDQRPSIGYFKKWLNFKMKINWNFFFKGVLMTEGELWRDQRRFSLRHLKDLGFGKSSMEDVMLDEIDQVLTALNVILKKLIFSIFIFNFICSNSPKKEIASRNGNAVLLDDVYTSAVFNVLWAVKFEFRRPRRNSYMFGNVEWLIRIDT